MLMVSRSFWKSFKIESLLILSNQYKFIILITVRLYSWNSFHYFHMTALILYLAYSLVNPIIYSLRMPGFKACVVRMFFKAPKRDNAADLPLNNR